MKIEPLKQPSEFTCAHTCVAMLAGISLYRAMKLFPRQTLAYGSLGKEISAALKKLGYSCSAQFHRKPRNWKDIPPMTLLMVDFKYKETSIGRHLLLKENDDSILDPRLGRIRRMPIVYELISILPVSKPLHN